MFSQQVVPGRRVDVCGHLVNSCSTKSFTSCYTVQELLLYEACVSLVSSTSIRFEAMNENDDRVNQEDDFCTRSSVYRSSF